MSDYIRKSALLKDKIWLCGGYVGDEYAKGYMEALDKVEMAINEQPTVDEKEIIRKTVEGIVERLEKEKAEDNDLLKFHRDNGTKSMEGLYVGKVNAFNDAIMIVKEEGGIE